MIKAFSSTLFFACCQALERVAGFVLLPVLTKSVSPSDYALWAQSVVAVGVVTPVALLGLHTAWVRFSPGWESDPALFRSGLWSMLTAITLVLSAIGVIAWFGSAGVSHLVFGAAPVGGGWLAGLFALLVGDVFFEFLVAIHRAAGRFRRLSLAMLVKGLLRLAVLAVALQWTDGDLAVSFLAYVAMNLLMVIGLYVVDVPVVGLVRSGWSASRGTWWQVLVFACPLVFLAIGTGIGNFNDRFFLMHHRLPATVAAYATAGSLVAMAAFIYSTIGMTLFPALAWDWSAGDRSGMAERMAGALEAYALISLPFVAVMVALGLDLQVLLTNDGYGIPRIVLPLLALGIVLFGGYQMVNYVLMLTHGSGRALMTVLGASLCNLGLNAVLIPRFGTVGAACANLATNAVLFGAVILQIRQEMPWKWPWATVLPAVLHSGILVGVLVMGRRWLPMEGVPGLLLVLSIGLSVYAALGCTNPGFRRLLLRSGLLGRRS